MKKLSYQSVFWFIALCFVLALGEFAKEILPNPKGRGVYDAQSIALFSLSIILLLTTLKIKTSRIAISFFVIFLFFFTLVNGWYFDFYRDYLTPDAVKLAIYAKETTMAWGGLKFKEEALKYLLLLIVLLLMYFKLEIYRPQKKVLVIVSLLFFGLAIQQQYEASKRYSGGAKHRGINHISYFVKSFFPKQKLKITQQHIQQLQSALPEKKINKKNDTYPLFEKVSKSIQPLKDKKNVIIVVLESVRAAETGLYPGHAESITPNLDKLAKESISFSNFYANSNQTVRGEVAILCSALDYMNGSPYSISGNKLKTNCLPSILKQQGYETYWIHGYKKKFFNRVEFYPKLGFTHIIDRDVINQENDKKMIGWGVSDTEMFESAMSILEKETKPFFAEVLTLSNHYPYLWDWGITFPDGLNLKQELNEESSNLYSAYKRGVHYTDYALGQFIEHFKSSTLYENTILMVTGDHGIWTFPPKLLDNQAIEAELEKNEKYFRLPYIVHYKGVEPKQIHQPTSQVDMAPTVLEYLNVSASNSFLGSSVLSRKEEGDYPVYFMAAGSYGVRRDNQYCYPVDTTDLCKSKYRSCGTSKKSDTKSVCVTSDHDLLNSSTSLEFIEVDQANDKTVIDLSQYFLEYGYMPDQDILELDALSSK